MTVIILMITCYYDHIQFKLFLMIRQVKAFLSDALDELKTTRTTKPIGYRFCLDCECNTGTPHTIDLEKCLTKDMIICAERCRIDTTGIKERFHGTFGS